MPLYYIESDTGTIHLTDHGQHGRAKSFCGSVTGSARRITNEWRAHQVIVGNASGVNINPNLCKRCLNTAKNQYPADFNALLEMADEHGTKQEMKREPTNARRDRGGFRPLEDDL